MPNPIGYALKSKVENNLRCESKNFLELRIYILKNTENTIKQNKRSFNSNNDF